MGSPQFFSDILFYNLEGEGTRGSLGILPRIAFTSIPANKHEKHKSCRQETLNLSTCADKSTNTIFFLLEIKSHTWETLNLSTNADSSTNTIKLFQ